MIQCESKRVAVRSGVLLEMELCLMPDERCIQGVTQSKFIVSTTLSWNVLGLGSVRQCLADNHLGFIRQYRRSTSDVLTATWKKYNRNVRHQWHKNAIWCFIENCMSSADCQVLGRQNFGLALGVGGFPFFPLCPWHCRFCGLFPGDPRRPFEVRQFSRVFFGVLKHVLVNIPS